MVGEMGKGGKSDKKKKSWNSLWKVRTQMARWLVLGPVLPTPPGCVSRPTAALTCDP